MKKVLNQDTLTFRLGQYKIELEKETVYDSIAMPKKDKFVVTYSKFIKNGNQRVEQKLMTKVYVRIFKKGKKIKEFANTYTYRSFCQKNVDKYTYIDRNCITYGINEIVKRDSCKFFNGICFEGKPNFEYLPFGYDMLDYIELIEPNIQSSISFKGKTINGLSYVLEIIKNNSEIKIKYVSRKPIESSTYYIDTSIEENKEFALPILAEGNITIEELNAIIPIIEQLGDNEFVAIAFEEINNFYNKLTIKKGLVKEIVDPLSPKILIDKPLEQIEMIINNRKNEYFKLIQEQFENITNPNSELEKRIKLTTKTL